jgi:hypothetical protein
MTRGEKMNSQNVRRSGQDASVIDCSNMTREEFLAAFDSDVAPKMLRASVQSVIDLMHKRGYPTEEELQSAVAWWSGHCEADIAKERARLARWFDDPDANTRGAALMPSNIKVAVTADVADLRAKLAVAKAEAAVFSSTLRTTAKDTRRRRWRKPSEAKQQKDWCHDEALTPSSISPGRRALCGASRQLGICWPCGRQSASRERHRGIAHQSGEGQRHSDYECRLCEKLRRRSTGRDGR